MIKKYASPVIEKLKRSNPQGNFFSLERLAGKIIFSILSFLLLAMWAISSPVGSSPDDDFHLASIYCSNVAKSELCVSTSNPKIYLISSAIPSSPCFQGQTNVTGDCQVLREVFTNPTTVKTENGNFYGKYPGLFYNLMALFATSDVVSSVYFMRIFNALIFAAFCLALSLKLPRKYSSTLTATWLLSVIPLGLFIIPSTNPSSWAVTGVMATYFAGLGFWSSKGKVRIYFAFLSIGAIALAIGARTDSSIFSVAAFAAALFMAKPPKMKTFFAIALGASVVTALILMFAKNTALDPSKLTHSEKHLSDGALNSVAVLGSNLFNLPDIVFGQYGLFGLGWLDTGMPSTVWLFAIMALSGNLYLYVSNHSARQTLILSVIGSMICIIPLYYLQVRNALVGQDFQPRYIMPLVTLFIAIWLTTELKTEVTLSTKQALTTFLLLSSAQSIALYENLSRYLLSDTHSGNWNLSELERAWWTVPLDPMAIWFSGTVIFVAVSGWYFFSNSKGLHEGNLGKVPIQNISQ